MLNASFYTENRKKLRKAVAGDVPIVITAAGHLQKSADTTYPFRQDSNFWYLTGLDEPDVILVIEQSQEYLILPPRNEVQVLFDGAIEHDDLTRKSGITTVLDSTEGWGRLTDTIKNTHKLATLEPAPGFIETYGFYTNPARARLVERIKEIAKVDIADIRPELARLRCIKQPAEISIMSKVVDATLDALHLLQGPLSQMTGEHEAAAFVTCEFNKQQMKHGYEPIVASGKNACTVHYCANNAPLDKAAYLLLDVGAQTSYYSADITRVLHPTKPSPRQQAIHQAVADVQQYAMSLLKPGVKLPDYEKQVERYMGKQLKQLKLITTADTKSVRKYFPYLASHFLGLDVHDVGDRSAPLEPGMVLTVEPGIHIPEESIAVRLEDDVVITQSGIEVLGEKR